MIDTARRLPDEVEGRPALYLRAEDVAAMLQVSKSSVFRLVKRDPSMPALVLGGIVRFPRERLLVWLRQREQGSTPRPRLKTIINPTPNKHGAVDLSNPATPVAPRRR